MNSLNVSSRLSENWLLSSSLQWSQVLTCILLLLWLLYVDHFYSLPVVKKHLNYIIIHWDLPFACSMVESFAIFQFDELSHSFHSASVHILCFGTNVSVNNILCSECAGALSCALVESIPSSMWSLSASLWCSMAKYMNALRKFKIVLQCSQWCWCDLLLGPMTADVHQGSLQRVCV